ncbi:MULTISPECIES: class I SAM-dependent methyltransferase [Acidobacteriaceae]|uniref:class I SAM-dependent methyltransferase n=1 Tax=Acidobacteriaceae TaxID=204434 RepID=UPI001C203A06|nr:MULTISPECIES: class I SAM-dependent methyltransferase [Acidobacteriaceae]MDW5264526.1 class I SAM-dependent methyltransferase [Edaphobacter sp.]
MSKSLNAKPNYGIDAPGVIRNLLVAGVICLLLALFGPRTLHIGNVAILLGSSLVWPAIFLLVPGLLMLLYSLHGKFLHRDRMLALHAWRGDEQVLDVGTGRGLLLVGAARHLTTGHATGIDVWNKEDLSNNSVGATQHNLELEGVAARCTLVSEGAQQMSFPDASFDVILSNLCLHNIYDRPTRNQALAEIVRVLKPGGIVILSDYKLTREYAEQLQLAGLGVERRPPDWLRTFPALAIIMARK